MLPALTFVIDMILQRRIIDSQVIQRLFYLVDSWRYVIYAVDCHPPQRISERRRARRAPARRGHGGQPHGSGQVLRAAARKFIALPA